MKDAHEADLPQEEGKLEESKALATPEENGDVNVETNEIPEEVNAPEIVETSVKPEAEQEEFVTEPAASAPVPEGDENTDGGDEKAEAIPVAVKLTKEEIVERLTELAEASVEASRGEIELLKQTYYKLRRQEIDELKKSFIEDGGNEEEFSAPEDETENKIKNILSAYKEKRAAISADEERVKAANYALKLQLIDQLKHLSESQEDFNKQYNKFKDIQQRWKEIKAVPQEHANELWRTYQAYSEKFYDIIKINNQFRDYDFKKNFELKTALCETVEKLQEEPDVISAFHQLQKLHQQWREIGPVSKELREEVWTRFKVASTVINKYHQEHFDKLKAKEQENLEEKTAICEQIEAIDFETLKTFKDWEIKNKEVLALQNKWKTIGFAPKKYNVKIFERFRAGCDLYFNRKSEFFKQSKDEMEKNLELKRELCVKAEMLKDNTDWKETTDKMIALQKEWKKVGPVARKHSDTIWKRFIAACDYFFEQKKAGSAPSQKTMEKSNLAAKKELIEKIHALDEALKPDAALALMKEYMAEWNDIGFVPFKEKDKVYQEFHEAVDNQFDRLKVDKNDRKMQAFRSNLNEMATEGQKGRLYSEREKLMRIYERMKGELQTYENNFGFFSISSKGGGGLVKEMEHKILKLKEDMELTIKKIEAIDENLD